MKTIFLIPLAFSALSTASLADPFNLPPNVTRETTLDMAPNSVWAAFGQFCSITEWQNLVASCEVTQKTDGLFRTVVMTDDTAYVERLIHYSDDSMSFGYTMLSGPAPVTDYVALFDIDPGENGDSIVRISAWYGVTDGASHDVVDPLLSGLFENGLAGMAKVLTN